jgi:hypothetical protein
MAIYFPPPQPFMGGRQPHEPARLNGALLDAGAGLPVNPPPTTLGGPVALPYELAAIAQPPTWNYVFEGGWQPYAPRTLNPSITAVEVDNPPFTDGGPAAIPSELAGLAQPNPWVYVFHAHGNVNAQPYDFRRLSAGNGLSVDPPPTTHRARTVQAAEIVAIWQPDPWTYNFAGGREPFLQRQIAPGVPGVSNDNPPFTDGGPAAIPSELASIAQPNPWVYAFNTRNGIMAQPYGLRVMSPAIPGMSVDNPPFTYGGPLALKLEGVAVNQPDWSYTAWPYVFMGARQPYEARKVPAQIAAVAVNNPPFDHRGREQNIQRIIAAWQPAPFNESFQMKMYASSIGPPRLRPTARGYIIL